jgi:hypothetical protein
MKDDEHIKQEIARYVAGLNKVKWLSQHAPIDSALVKSGRVRVFTGETWYAAYTAVWDATYKPLGGRHANRAAYAAYTAARLAADAYARINLFDYARTAVNSARQRRRIINAAESAALVIARHAAHDAAVDALLECCMVEVCGDLNIDQKHRDHSKLRMDIWRAGWAVLCDFYGVLYVYGQNKETDK